MSVSIVPKPVERIRLSNQTHNIRQLISSVKFYQSFQGYKQSRNTDKKGRVLEYYMWLLMSLLHQTCASTRGTHEVSTKVRKSPHLEEIFRLGNIIGLM